jgi:uncharacterized protein YybS (DUF2232 family)
LQLYRLLYHIQEVNDLNNGWKSLAWSAAALLLLLTLWTPLNVVTTFLIMTPFVVLYSMLKPRIFAAHIVSIGLVAYLLSGAYGPIVLTLAFFFLVPSLVMGHLYKRGSTARTVILVGFVVVLAQLLLELAIFSWQFDIDLRAELASFLSENLIQLETGGLFPAGWAADMATSYSNLFITILPMFLLLIAFLFTIITHGLSRRALRTVNIEASALPQAKTWRMPKALVVYYLITMIISFFVSSEEGGYWYVVVANLLPILQFVFIVQAIGFFFFLADAKKWSKVIPIVLTIPLLLFPPFYLIGLIDVAFPLRKYFVK